MSNQCPLYPRKQTFADRDCDVRLSAFCRKETCVVRKVRASTDFGKLISDETSIGSDMSRLQLKT